MAHEFYINQYTRSKAVTVGVYPTLKEAKEDLELYESMNDSTYKYVISQRKIEDLKR